MLVGHVANEHDIGTTGSTWVDLSRCIGCCLFGALFAKKRLGRRGCLVRALQNLHHLSHVFVVPPTQWQRTTLHRASLAKQVLIGLYVGLRNLLYHHFEISQEHEAGSQGRGRH